MKHYKNDSFIPWTGAGKWLISSKTTRHWRTCLAGACAVALLAGCSALAPLPPPALEPGPGWQARAPEGWVSTQGYQQWPEQPWWQWFGDAPLDALMERIEIGNHNLAQAQANLAQAQALLRQNQAQQQPSLGLQLGAQRSSAAGSANAGLVASWAPDLWGRLAASEQAQQASVQASQAQLAGVRLSAQASLAQAYWALREADAETALLQDIASGYERALAITENNYRTGMVARTDVLQAQSQLESTRASLQALRKSRAGYEHALALLVGQVPARFAVASAPWAGQVPQLPALLPAQLLLRRPDVAAAERAVAAANANIGVARAAWFPSLNLSANLGGASPSLGQLLSAPALTWSLGATLAQALLDGGARNAAIEQAQAAHQAASANYRQVALTAIGQVEDQLTALDTLAGQIRHSQAAAEAATEAEQRILNGYRAGITAYSAVITAQTSALNARRQVLQLQLQRQQAAVALIQALGGGWQAPWVETGQAGPGAERAAKFSLRR
ncbi:efflux transporter outer membrane subunit [Melaminivora sp.]